MPDDAITRWFSRLHHISGVAAYGLQGNDGEVFTRGWSTDATEPALRALWKRLAEIVRTTVPAGEQPASLRWTFSKHVVTGAMRADGVTFFVLRPRDEHHVDAAGIDRVTNEFRALRP